MAQKFSTPIDMGQLEILNPRAQNLAAAPGSPQPGQWWFNTTSGRMEIRGNSAVYDPTDRASHTGTQLAATISNLATVVKAYRLDEFAQPTADLNLGGRKLTNGAAGVSGTDFAVVSQVNAVQTALDQAIAGLDIKQSVRVAATANTALTGVTVLDGYTLAGSNQRVLLPAQTNPVENGIYLWNAGTLTRAPDAVTGTLSAGAIVVAEVHGTTNKNTSWRLETADPITTGTTAQTWTKFAAPFTPVQGAGIGISGSTISADVVSVFGRIGAVVATAGDYNAAKITNDSAVSGATVKDALETLNTSIGAAVRKYATTLATSATSYTVTHGLNTLDVTVSVYAVATGEEVFTDVLRTGVNTVSVGFAVAPSANAYRVVVTG